MPLEPQQLAAAPFAAASGPAVSPLGPVLYKGAFTADKAGADTFVFMEGWTKGLARPVWPWAPRDSMHARPPV